MNKNFAPSPHVFIVIGFAAFALAMLVYAVFGEGVLYISERRNQMRAIAYFSCGIAVFLLVAGLVVSFLQERLASRDMRRAATALMQKMTVGAENQFLAEHAYPLQQISIMLQGTRHSDRADIINQLETVLARLRAGDTHGFEHDNGFGYSFLVEGASRDPSFFV